MANNGNRSRFRDRIKRIAWFRRKKRTRDDANNPAITVLKVMAAIPGMVYDNTINQNISGEKTNLKTNNTSLQLNNRIRNKSLIVNKNRVGRIINRKQIVNNRLNRRNNILTREEYLKKKAIVNGINVDNIKKNQEGFFTKVVGANLIRDGKQKQEIPKQDSLSVRSKNQAKGFQELVKRVEEEQNIEKQDKRAQELEKQIINIIKKKLIKTVNELEIIYSELYLLSEVNGESKLLEECKEELAQVKKMLSQIDKLKEQYDYLKDNYDFEYLLELDDEPLVDKIIELKNNFDHNEIRAVATDYKLLDVYKYLYLKIDNLQEKTVRFYDEKKREEEKLAQRDVDFEKLKKDVRHVGNVNHEYEQFIKNQNEIIEELNSKINNITSHEEISYRLNGISRLCGNTFKYFALLMLNPLKGLVPSIAVSTLATRNMLKILANQVTFTKEKKIVYEANNYSSLLSGVIDDLDVTDNLINESLIDIVNLKHKYEQEFREYYNDFSEYRGVIAKINDMENKILGNKVKIEIMRSRAIKQKKENWKTLRLVDKYNSKSTV